MKKDKILHKLKNQYRLIIYNDTTFQSVWNMKLSRLKVFTITSLVSAGLVILIILLIAMTNLREYIPGYPKAEYREMLVHNALKVDSLEQELAQRDKFFDGIKAIVNGDVPQSNAPPNDNTEATNVEFQQYNHDSIFQDKIEEEQLSLSLNGSDKNATEISQMHFFVPLKGIISDQFKSTPDHYGVDIVSDPNARISAVQDGTVIFAGWTLKAGYVVYIQHDANLISVYKHNSELLKKTGEKVKAGEAIAIMGNTGELTNGPHLHFELWHEGTALDPEQYIDF